MDKSECIKLMLGFFAIEKRSITLGFENLETEDFYVDYLTTNIVDEFNSVDFIRNFVRKKVKSLAKLIDSNDESDSTSRVDSLALANIKRWKSLFFSMGIRYRAYHIVDRHNPKIKENIQSVFSDLGVNLSETQLTELHDLACLGKHKRNNLARKRRKLLNSHKSTFPV